jgi:hypothetical protein
LCSRASAGGRGILRFASIKLDAVAFRNHYGTMNEDEDRETLEAARLLLMSLQNESCNNGDHHCVCTFKFEERYGADIDGCEYEEFYIHLIDMQKFQEVQKKKELILSEMDYEDISIALQELSCIGSMTCHIPHCLLAVGSTPLLHHIYSNLLELLKGNGELPRASAYRKELTEVLRKVQRT